MGWFVSFLISLAVSLVMSVISMLLMPTVKKTDMAAGELEPPSASEGIPIPHVRGTRFVSPNCLWWTPTGNSAIIR